jgi:TRAP-type C4-dicarboxylate transport system permease small subunit
MWDLLTKLDRWLDDGLRWFSIMVLVMLAVVLTGVVFVRFVPIAKLSWSDEAIEWAFAWMVFMGAAILWRRNEHFCVDALSKKLGRTKGGLIHRLVVETLCLCFFCIFTYYSYQLTVSANDRSPILEWPRPLWYGCMPLSGMIMSVYSVRTIIRLLMEWIAPQTRFKGIPTGRKDNVVSRVDDRV